MTRSDRLLTYLLMYTYLLTYLQRWRLPWHPITWSQDGRLLLLSFENRLRQPSDRLACSSATFATRRRRRSTSNRSSRGGNKALRSVTHRQRWRHGWRQRWPAIRYGMTSSGLIIRMMSCWMRADKRKVRDIRIRPINSWDPYFLVCFHGAFLFWTVLAKFCELPIYSKTVIGLSSAWNSLQWLLIEFLVTNKWLPWRQNFTDSQA